MSIYVYVKRGDMSTAKQDMLYNKEIYDVDGNLIGMYDRFGTKKIRTVENSHDRSETIDSISHETYVQDDKYDVNTLLLNMVNDIHGKVLDEEEKDMTFYELGFNSTDLIGLVSQLEMQLDIELYPTLLFEYNTFNLRYYTIFCYT
jgi:acyl carrier protein